MNALPPGAQWTEPSAQPSLASPGTPVGVLQLATAADVPRNSSNDPPMMADTIHWPPLRDAFRSSVAVKGGSAPHAPPYVPQVGRKRCQKQLPGPVSGSVYVPSAWSGLR